MNESASAIAWETDIRRKFKNPPPNAHGLDKIDQWLDEEIFPGKVENGHFIVWMRGATTSDFRKLYGRIDEEIKLPVTISIDSRYPIERYKGKKGVLLTKTSWMGGKNAALGVTYILTGSLCLLVAAFFFLKHSKDPRSLGDVRYLNWQHQSKAHGK